MVNNQDSDIQVRAELDDLVAWVEEVDAWWLTLTPSQKVLLLQGMDHASLRPFFSPIRLAP